MHSMDALNDVLRELTYRGWTLHFRSNPDRPYCWQFWASKWLVPGEHELVTTVVSSPHEADPFESQLAECIAWLVATVPEMRMIGTP